MKRILGFVLLAGVSVSGFSAAPARAMSSVWRCGPILGIYCSDRQSIHYGSGGSTITCSDFQKNPFGSGVYSIPGPKPSEANCHVNT
jgi:hypothetical protein